MQCKYFVITTDTHVIYVLTYFKLVDSAGWNVVDTYQLPEFEHGLAIQVVRLSDVSKVKSHSYILFLSILTNSIF